MLKKMRWRFIGASMAAFLTVIIGLVCLVNVWNYFSVVRQLNDTLETLSVTEPQNPPGPQPFKNFSPEVKFMMRFFVVTCDKEGQITEMDHDNIASVSEEDAEDFVKFALNKGKDRGFYKGYRYLFTENEEDDTIIFLNAERELQNMKTLLSITAMVAFGSSLIVFILVFLFSKRAIAPFARNVEMQKQFITNASHELKTPLTSILASADILDMEQEDNEWVQNIRQQSGYLSRLIQNLITLSRLDEENPFPEKSEFSLSDAVWEIAEPFSSLAKARHKEYTQHIEDGLVLVGDMAAIQQMVSILLDNAMKYSEENGRISLLVQKSSGKVEIEVFNTCKKEEGADISRIFERFYRMDESHSGRVKGTGIGLSIAKATVEAHGGSIRASYQKDGILFRVVL